MADAKPIGPVLVVEDDEATAELERRVLHRAGLEVHTVTLVAEALAALQSRPFSAVLLDFRLPDGDPWDVVLLAQAAAPRIPVILVTAMGNERVAMEALHRGVDDYIRKADNFWEQLPDAVGRAARAAGAEHATSWLAAIVDSSEDAILAKRMDGTIASWNAGAERMLGYTAREMLGHSIHALLPLELHAAEELLLQQVRRGDRIRQVESVLIRKDGTRLEVSRTLSAVTDEAGHIIGTSTIARDITERRRVQRMKDELISVVSHELRTPLTSIRGALGLLLSGGLGALPSQARRMGDIALSNTNRLVRLINDMLDLERLASGSVSLDKHGASSAALMAQAREALQPLAEAAGVWLCVEPFEAQLWVDTDRILQVLTNLLGNAIKFSEPRGTVRLSAAPLQDLIRFEVRDEGRGVPQEQLEIIFERFHQVDASDSREKGGTGLGLPICRHIVEQHGGSIWAESRLGEGSAFFFTLPRAAP